MNRMLKELLLPFLLVLGMTGSVMYYIGRDPVRDALRPTISPGESPAADGNANRTNTAELMTVDSRVDEEVAAAEPPPTPEPSTPVAEPTSVVPSEAMLDFQALEKLWESMTRQELEVEYETLNSQVQEITKDAYQARFEAGQYEVVGYGGELVATNEDRTKLVSYLFVPIHEENLQEIRRVELLQEEYPDAHEMHRRAIRVFDEIRERHQENHLLAR